MPDPKKDIIEPVTIDVGSSPDVAGVVSILTCADGNVVIHGLPPQAALAYAEKLVEVAKRILAGSVRVSLSAETFGASLRIERSRPERSDS